MTEEIEAPPSRPAPAGCRSVAIVGCGHVGLVTAACLASLGHRVRGVDIDEELVAALKAGRVALMEPGLPELVRKTMDAGRLTFTGSYEEAIPGAEFVFLCVNTPATPTGAADLRYVRSAAARVAAALAAHPGDGLPVIVNKSTSPIGTGETIEAVLSRTFDGPRMPRIVANPEFLREGSAVHDFFHPDRIVVGAEAAEDAAAVASLYAGIGAPVIETDLRTAELIKYVSNAFLATRVSFVNEVARLCENLGIDVDTVVQGATLDPRIGAAFFKPGIGYGGSCLPKDVAALCHSGDSAGSPMRVLAAVQDANIGQRKHAVNSIRKMLGRLEGLTIAAWGVTFKGGTEDLRDSPALDVIALLRNEGARVHAYDPALAGAGHGAEFADELHDSPIEAARGAHCVAILTDWPQFAALDWAAVAAAMKGKLVYDGRNLLDRATVERAGLVYYGVGRPPSRRNG
jgi:UDPglucose 6-dehydrogenase